MIELLNVNKNKGKYQILKNINFKFENGNVYNIIGENASGKSVLLKIITHIWLPTTGSVIQDNINITQRQLFLNNYSFFYNDLELEKDKTVKDNIKNSVFKYQDEKCSDLLKLFNLEKNKEDIYKNLSFGMQQKVKLIITFLKDAEIYILDEPFNGLDKNSVVNLNKLIIKEKEKGKIVIVTSHIKKALDIESKKVILENGEIKNVE